MEVGQDPPISKKFWKDVYFRNQSQLYCAHQIGILMILCVLPCDVSSAKILGIKITFTGTQTKIDFQQWNNSDLLTNLPILESLHNSIYFISLYIPST